MRKPALVSGLAAFILVIVGAITNIGSFVDMAGKSSATVSPFLIQHENLRVPAEFRKLDHVALTGWVLPASGFLVVLLVAVIILWIRSNLSGGAASARAAADLEVANAAVIHATATADAATTALQQARSTLQELIQEDYQTGQAIRQIARQGYDGQQHRLNFKDIYCRFEIDDQGDTLIHQTLTVEARDEPGQLWEFFFSDVDDPQIVSKKSLQIGANSISPNTDLAILGVNFRNHKKELLAWFLPEVAPNTRRSFEIQCRIPGWFKKLFSSAPSDTWVWHYGCRDQDDLANIKFEFVFPRGSGPFSAKMAHKPISGQKLSNTTNDQGQMVITYEAQNVPVGKVTWQIYFQKT